MQIIEVRDALQKAVLLGTFVLEMERDEGVVQSSTQRLLPGSVPDASSAIVETDPCPVPQGDVMFLSDNMPLGGACSNRSLGQKKKLLRVGRESPRCLRRGSTLSGLGHAHDLGGAVRRLPG